MSLLMFFSFSAKKKHVTSTGQWSLLRSARLQWRHPHFLIWRPHLKQRQRGNTDTELQRVRRDKTVKGEVCLFCLWSELTWQADAGQTQLWRSSDHVVLSSQQRSGLNPVKPWSVGLMMGCSSRFTSGSQHHNSCAETLRIIILFCLKPKFFRFGGSPWSHG